MSENVACKNCNRYNARCNYCRLETKRSGKSIASAFEAIDSSTDSDSDDDIPKLEEDMVNGCSTHPTFHNWCDECKDWRERQANDEYLDLGEFSVEVEDDLETEESEIDVEVHVRGVELDETQAKVVDTYAENIETFLRKNADYGSSFTDSAKVESILKHGEVREDELPELMAQQIFVRGMMDKISRFYQLAFQSDGALVDDEALDDTLLDLGNYAIMLASQLRAEEEA